VMNMRVLKLLGVLSVVLLLSSCSFVPFAKIPFSVTFDAPVTFGVHPRPLGLLSADFDGDGHLDLVTVHLETNQLVFYKGDGAGNFEQKTTLTVAAHPVAYTVVDANADGLPDVWVLQDETARLSLLLGDADAGLRLGSSVELAHQDKHDHAQGAGDPQQFTLGDFNGDGLTDVVLGYEKPTLDVYLGDDQGGFQRSDALVTDLHKNRLATLDVDEDGRDDLLVFGTTLSVEGDAFDGSQLQVYRGEKQGFSEPQKLAGSSDFAWKLELADFNGDGLLDPIMGFVGTGLLGILPNEGGGTFGKATNFLIKKASDITFADLDQDGQLDFVTSVDRGKFSMGEIHVFINAGSLRVRAPKAFPARLGPQALTSGDFDENGLPDVAVANFFSDDISLFFNRTPLP